MTYRPSFEKAEDFAQVADSGMVYQPSKTPVLLDFVTSVWEPDHRGLRNTTLDNYEHYLAKYVLPCFADWPIGTITHSDVQRMINRCPSFKTGKDAKDTLSTVLGYAHKACRIIPYNPATGRFTYPPKVNGIPKQGDTLQDFRQIKVFLNRLAEDNAPKDVLQAVSVGLLFGLRPGEDRGLDSEDFDFAHGLLHIHNNFTVGSHKPSLNDVKTPRGDRYLCIYPTAEKWLKQFSFAPGPWILNSKGTRAVPSTLRQKYASFRDRNALQNITLETCRHSFATAALHAGMSLNDLADWLGHADPAFTAKHYIRGDLTARKKAGDIIESAFSTELPSKNYEDLDEAVKKVLEKLADEGVLSLNIAA